jgi:predicted nucleic acid-binding protein
VTPVLVDTGPIVALLNARDEYHEWARTTFSVIEPPLVTCEPVLAEAAHLVRRLDGGPNAVLDLVARGVVRVDFRVDAELLALRTLLARYASVPMSLTDACLVRMVELNPRSRVVTLDSDFRVYRRSGRLAIPLVTPRKV